MGFDKRIMVLEIGHFSVCMDGFDTLGLGLKQALLLISNLAMWCIAVGRNALAADTAITFFKNAQKTSAGR